MTCSLDMVYLWHQTKCNTGNTCSKCWRDCAVGRVKVRNWIGFCTCDFLGLNFLNKNRIFRTWVWLRLIGHSLQEFTKSSEITTSMIDSFSSMKLLEWVCTSELFAVYNVVVNSMSGRSKSMMVRLDFTLGVNGAYICWNTQSGQPRCRGEWSLEVM